MIVVLRAGGLAVRGIEPPAEDAPNPPPPQTTYQWSWGEPEPSAEPDPPAPTSITRPISPQPAPSAQPSKKRGPPKAKGKKGDGAKGNGNGNGETVGKATMEEEEDEDEDEGPVRPGRSKKSSQINALENLLLTIHRKGPRGVDWGGPGVVCFGNTAFGITPMGLLRLGQRGHWSNSEIHSSNDIFRTPSGSPSSFQTILGNTAAQACPEPRK